MQSGDGNNYYRSLGWCLYLFVIIFTIILLTKNKGNMAAALKRRLTGTLFNIWFVLNI